MNKMCFDGSYNSLPKILPNEGIVSGLPQKEVCGKTRMEKGQKEY